MPKRLGIFVAIPSQEMRQQKGHVFPAIAQRRNLEVDYVQAVIKIFAEAALSHQRKELYVGSGYNAHVDSELLGAAEAHEFALLNHAQKLGLRFRTDGGDFIEENGALVGDLEETLLGSNRASEGTFHMAEELGLQQIHRNRSCVYGHEGLVRAGGGRVNGLGDEFLTGAAFAADKNRGA